MSSERQLLSVVVPIYFEEQTIREFYRRSKAALEQITPRIDHELIFVNDGSTDRSIELLTQIAYGDPAVKVIDLSRNFGHQLAITAGMDHAAGDAVVMMDGDLQDPPEVIAEMVARWREGYKVVYGVRRVRKGETKFKLWTAAVFYRLMSKLSEIDIPLDSGDFRLLDRVVVDALGQVREQCRYIRGLITWLGFKQCPLPYTRDERYAGTTKFSIGKMFRFALDGISSFSDKPLRFSTQFGMVVTASSILYTVWLILGRIFTPERTVQGWTSVMVAVLFLGGVQLLTVGLLGEYIGRIFRETKSRPLYFVANRINFESETIPSKPRSLTPAGDVPASRES